MGSTEDIERDTMVYLFILIVAVLGIAIYLTVVLSSVPGAVDERLGKLEELPENLGQWVTDRESPEAKNAEREGLLRETRVLHEPAKSFLFGKETLTEQARYRDASGKIVRVDAERKWARKRRKGPPSE